MNETTFPVRIAVDDPPSDAGTTATGPVQPSERMQIVDVLRGFALLGIIQVNWQQDFASPLEFLVDGSFFTTFSFLFGLGFAIQIIRAEETKRPFILRYLWRSLILFFIGTAHFIFIWHGDALVEYALIGVLLLFVRSWRPGLIIAVAVAVLVFSMSPRLAPDWRVLTRINPEQVETERLHVQLEASIASIVPASTGPYLQTVSVRAVRVWEQVTQRMVTLQWWQGGHTETLFMFLLGLYAGRRRLFRDTEQHMRFFIWVGTVGLVFGLAGNGLAVFGDFFTEKGIALPKAFAGWRLAYSLGNIGLSLFYMAGVTLLFTNWGRATRLLAPLAYVGRMGLTNYLMQSVILAIILGRGFGLHIGRDGVVDGWPNLLLVNAFFAVQILYSYWWFQYFRFGPVEWAWRSLTWFRIQRMRAAPQKEEAELAR